MRIPSLLAALATLAFGGCAALPTNLETPEVSFVALRAVEASVFEQRLEVRMKVRNPNDIELPVNGLDVDIELADEPFAHGVSAREFVVPAGGEAEFDMLVTANAATALLKIASADRKTDSIPYNVKGKLSTKIGLLRTIPFDESGTLRSRTCSASGARAIERQQIRVAARAGELQSCAMIESTSYRRIEKVISHIDRHHERQPDLGELARVAGLSVFHFSREFRRWAGLSPTRYLRTLSLSAAKRELEERGSVLTAAWAAGLSGGGRLHDLFVQFDAVTPGEYKAGGSGMRLRTVSRTPRSGACSPRLPTAGSHFSRLSTAARRVP